jgi:hypothetical protein
MSSEIIYSGGKPIFLYIKQHTKTGLMYFGKTYKDPEKYLGSGTYWLNHINQHGKEYVINLWYCLFTDENSLTEFAKSFSEENDIVNSDLWANLAIENGTDGGPRENNYLKEYNKLPRSKEHGNAISSALKGKITSYMKSRMKRCKIDDVEFESYAAVAKVYNVTDEAVRYWVKIGKVQLV